MKKTAVTLPREPGDFTTDKRVVTLSGMAIVIGLISAGIAYLLVRLINIITNLAFFQSFSSAPASPADHHLGLWVILVPVIGGIIIGFMAKYGSEKIRGHGIPEALEAILIGRSRIQAKVAILKPVSSAISIGTGGPFGAEGPIIMTGGAFGSLFAQFFHLTSVERKTLLVAGAAAGMAAVFSAPISAVLLAVELLLFEWKPGSFIPVAVAAAVAGAARIPLLGYGPIFPVPPHGMMASKELLYAVLLGLAAGFASGALTALVYGFEDLFGKLTLHWMWWPAIGGLVVGIGGYIDPRILGVGYDLIHSLLRGDILGASVLGLLAGKALVWSFALGSGTSGGVLAPLLIMGGAIGAGASHWIPGGDAGLWATIGMAAMMAGTMRSPFTAIVFTLELTHDLNTLPALLLGSVAAEIVTVLLLRRSILTEKVARHGHHITREYAVDPLELVRVADVMDSRVPSVEAGMTVNELAGILSDPRSPLCRHQGLPIVDRKGKITGIITRGDVFRLVHEEPENRLTVLEAGTRNPAVAYPDEPVNIAAARMLSRGIGRLPVVSRDDPGRLVGYLGRQNILSARMRSHEANHLREPGWLNSLRPGGAEQAAEGS